MSELPGGEQDVCSESSAAYVLGALSEQEYEQFCVHLHSCAVCREEVAALQAVVDALPALAPPLDAPAELKQRVMAVVQEDLGASRATRPARKPRRALAAMLGLRPALSLGGLTAAIVVVAIVFGSGDGGAGTRVIRAQVLAPRASASLRLSGGHAELQVAGMPQTTPGRVYEVWVKRAGAAQPTDALFSVTANGSATVGVPGSISGVKVVMVTSEPLGGSRVPTRPPVIVANIA